MTVFEKTKDDPKPAREKSPVATRGEIDRSYKTWWEAAASTEESALATPLAASPGAKRVTHDTTSATGIAAANAAMSVHASWVASSEGLGTVWKWS